MKPVSQRAKTNSGPTGLTIRLLVLLGCTAVGCAASGVRDFSDLRLQSQRIDLHELRDGEFRARIAYRFTGSYPPNSIAFPETHGFRLLAYKAVWNGQTLPVERLLPGPEESFALGNRNFVAVHVSPLPPGSGQVHSLLNEYRFRPRIAYEKNGPGRYAVVEYVLRTGGAWEGSVDSVEAYLHLRRPVCLASIVVIGSYAGKCIDDHTWVLVLRNVHLNRDIELLVPITNT